MIPVGDDKTTPKLIQKYYNNSDESINYDVITITEMAVVPYHSFFTLNVPLMNRIQRGGGDE